MEILKAMLFAPLLVGGFSSHAAIVELGDYRFDSAAFGDTLVQSDGGHFAFSNWLNTKNTDPGAPAYLTGANFGTGIANIGFPPGITYTIGYDAGILNGGGVDLGVVVARYTEDPFDIAISEDGATFTAPRRIEPATAHDTGVHQAYYYGGGGPFDAELFVHEIELSDYGFAEGTVIQAVAITGLEQLDLIRVAGVTAAVPEPAAWAWMPAGLATVVLVARRRQPWRPADGRGGVVPVDAPVSPAADLDLAPGAAAQVGWMSPRPSSVPTDTLPSRL